MEDKIIIDKIRRKLEIFKAYFLVNIKSILINKADFFIGALTMIIKSAISILLLTFVYRNMENIGGNWRLQDLYLLYAINASGLSIWSFFFINTITLPFYIRSGELDRFLIRPLSPFAQIMLDGFDVDSAGELFVSLVFLLFSLQESSVKAGSILFVVPLVLTSCLIYAAISIILSALNFLFNSRRTYANFTIALSKFGNYPLSIYPRYLQAVFIFIFPVGVAAYFPYKAINTSSFPKALGITFGIIVFAISFFLLSIKIWEYCLQKYSSTGS